MVRKPSHIDVLVGSTIEIDVEVEGTVYRGNPGRLSGPPEDCYPPEPPSAEDFKVYAYTKFGDKKKRVDITDLLTEKDLDDLSEQLIEEASNEIQCMEDDYADRKYDEMKDEGLV